jgi:hypothetical protein
VKRDIILFLLIFIVLTSISRAAIDMPISLDSPIIVENYLYNSYELLNINLRLPDIEERVFSEEAQNKLLDLANIYEPNRTNNNYTYNLLESEKTISLDKQLFNYTGNSNVFTLEPLPGVSLNAEYDKDELDLLTKENTNISLNYRMNKRTLIWAEYGWENRGWWDIVPLNIVDKEPDNPEEDSNENTYDEGNTEEIIDKEIVIRPSGSITFHEESNERGRLGIAYKTSDYLTISADYINDFNSGNNSSSTIIGLEYRDDDLGRVRYHYQLDRGNDNARTTGLELGFKDLATFNATYKIYNPETIEEQLNQWIFGIGLNLNDSSTLSFEYLWKQDNPAEDLVGEENKDEPDIKAKLEIKF